MIEPGQRRLSIQRQCRPASISRSARFNQPVGEVPLNLELLWLLGAQFLEVLWHGSRQGARRLHRQVQRVPRAGGRLMANIGLPSIDKVPRATIPHPEATTSKDRLRNLLIDRPNGSRAPTFR